MALTIDFMLDNDAPTFYRSLAKCRSIIEAGKVDVGYSFDGDDYGKCVSGPKVEPFYDCILNPDSKACAEHSLRVDDNCSSCVHATRSVVVDRHAYDIWMGKVGTDRSRKKLDNKGMHERIARDYQAVADSRGLAPHVVQAVTWCTWRRVKGVVDAYTDMEEF